MKRREKILYNPSAHLINPQKKMENGRKDGKDIDGEQWERETNSGRGKQIPRECIKCNHCVVFHSIIVFDNLCKFSTIRNLRVLSFENNRGQTDRRTGGHDLL